MRPGALPLHSPPLCHFCAATTLSLLLALLAIAQPGIAQQRHADTVVMFRPGSGPGIGREAKYFPKNVLGLPDSSARPTVPSVDPVQILSLGLGGEIVLGFNVPIVDGPGADFTVFENAFLYNLGGKQRTFAEPAAVAVSRDGVSFTEFPFDSLTLVGCAGITPTDGRADPFNPTNSGGDQFDLSTVVMDSIRYLRLRDVTGIVINNPNHPSWDPTLTSFDLDAVVALHTASPGGSNADTGALPQPIVLRFGSGGGQALVVFQVSQQSHVRVRVWNRLGQQSELVVDATLPAGTHTIPFYPATLGSGVWFLTLEESGKLIATHTFGVTR